MVEVLVLVVTSEDVRSFVVVLVAIVVIAVVEVFQVVVVFIPRDVVLVLVHVFVINEVLLGSAGVVEMTLDPLAVIGVLVR